jgi:hypothetical protein
MDGKKLTTKFTGPPSDELAIRMLCAWNNIPREQAHADWSRHANQWTMEAWERVADAVRAYDMEAVFQPQVEVTVTRNWLDTFSGLLQKENDK